MFHLTIRIVFLNVWMDSIVFATVKVTPTIDTLQIFPKSYLRTFFFLIHVGSCILFIPDVLKDIWSSLFEKFSCFINQVIFNALRSKLLGQFPNPRCILSGTPHSRIHQISKSNVVFHFFFFTKAKDLLKNDVKVVVLNRYYCRCCN